MIGSVDTAEFVVAGAASVGFLIGLGTEGFLLPTVAALLVGGLIAAPLAAWLVRIVPAQLLGAAIGGVIVLTNARTLIARRRARTARPAGASTLLLAAGWLAALVLAVRALRCPLRPATPRGVAAPSPTPSPPAAASRPRRAAGPTHR